VGDCEGCGGKTLGEGKGAEKDGEEEDNYEREGIWKAHCGNGGRSSMEGVVRVF